MSHSVMCFLPSNFFYKRYKYKNTVSENVKSGCQQSLQSQQRLENFGEGSLWPSQSVITHPWVSSEEL